MEKEAAFKVGKLLKLLARIGQRGAAHFDILLSASVPGAFCRGQDVRVDVVLPHDVLLRGRLRVVPRRADGARHVGSALLFVVDVALVDAHQVGVHVEVVRIVIAAVNVGQARHHSARRGPHLRHVTLFGGGSSRHQAVPHHHFLSLAAHIVRHRLQEVGISDGHLVAADVDVGRVGEHLYHLVQYLLQCLHALIRLHIEAHGLGEHIAVARHVDFRDDRNAPFGSVSLQLAALVLRVVLSRVAGHVLVRR